MKNEHEEGIQENAILKNCTKWGDFIPFYKHAMGWAYAAQWQGVYSANLSLCVLAPAPPKKKIT